MLESDFIISVSSPTPPPHTYTHAISQLYLIINISVQEHNMITSKFEVLRQGFFAVTHPCKSPLSSANNFQPIRR